MNDFNYDLAHRVVDQIRAYPEEHDQGVWRCETGMCFAGWASTLAGLEFVSNVPNSLWFSWVYVTPEMVELAAISDAQPGTLMVAHFDDRPIMHVADAAQLLLGLDINERESLFASSNSADDLEALVKVLEATDPSPERKNMIREIREEVWARYPEDNEGDS